MSIELRIALILVSVLCSVFILVNIRKAKVRIEDSVFWILLSLLLIILSIFPKIVVWGATLVRVQSPANFIFLVIIFLLMIKVFRQTLSISRLESKIQTIAQKVAIEEHDKKKQ